MEKAMLSVKIRNLFKGFNFMVQLKNVVRNGQKSGCSGFITNPENNRVIYLSTDIYPTPSGDVLIRFAKGNNDYVGDINKFATNATLRERVVEMLTAENVRMFSLPDEYEDKAEGTVYVMDEVAFVRQDEESNVVPDEEQGVVPDEEQGVVPDEEQGVVPDVICANCGAIIEPSTETITLSDGQIICMDCAHLDYAQCEYCGEYLKKEEMAVSTGYYFNDTKKYLCSECADNWRFCSDCGALLKNSEAIATDAGDFICLSCYDESYFTCEQCGAIHQIDDGVRVGQEGNEEWWCTECAEREAYRCFDCGNYFRREQGVLDDGDAFLCHDCFAYNDYTVCSNCGTFILASDASYVDEEAFCDVCFSSQTVIQEYHSHHKNGLVFFDGEEPTGTYGERGGKRYFGIELELMAGERMSQSPHEQARTMLDILNSDLWHCEHDGSVGDSGFELISQPFDRVFYETTMRKDVTKALDNAIENGYLSHKALNDCGLHVHVNRSSLSDDALAKLVIIIDMHWDMIVRLSRRNAEQLHRWAERYDAVHGNTITDLTVYNDIKQCAKFSMLSYPDGRHKRYHALNLTNKNTVEFRFFRGTLRSNTFNACLDWIDFLCNFCTDESLTVIAGLTDRQLLQKAREYSSELAEYIDRRFA